MLHLYGCRHQPRFLRGDTFHIDEEVHFSIVNDTIAKRAMVLNGNGKRIVLGLNGYKGMLPWRGNSRLVAADIAVDSDRVEVRPVAMPAE